MKHRASSGDVFPQSFFGKQNDAKPAECCHTPDNSEHSTYLHQIRQRAIQLATEKPKCYQLQGEHHIRHEEICEHGFSCFLSPIYLLNE